MFLRGGGCTSFSVTAFSLRLQLNSSHVFFSSLSSLLDSLFCLCLVYSITSSILALCDPPFSFSFLAD
ncbi:hypothetical protein E4U52_006757, partial [Claviceps spartinae]